MLLHEEEACRSYRQSSSWHLLQVGNIIHHASPIVNNKTLFIFIRAKKGLRAAIYYECSMCNASYAYGLIC